LQDCVTKIMTILDPHPNADFKLEIFNLGKTSLRPLLPSPDSTYLSDIVDPGYHFVHSIVLEFVLWSIPGLDLNLSTFSLLANKLDPDWSVRICDFTQLEMNYKKRTVCFVFQFSGCTLVG